MLDKDDLVCEDEWDTGDLECGELLRPLRKRVEALSTGGIIKLITRDPIAAIDLHAWCRVTGHRMLKSDPPCFFIQRKDD
jgi:tRNA 2-thiouridine synthesizing protein A